MSTQRYAVTQPPIETLFAWIKSGEVAIPEIQRPFVWNAIKVRNLLDSLFRGYPVGYLIAWRNPDVKLKDGTSSSGKRILIDGQQRVTALMASLLGREVFNDEYERVRIRIAFHPQEQRFEVANPAIDKDATWIPDVARVFDPHTSMFDLVNEYCVRNPGTIQQDIFRNIDLLRGITSNQIGLIELASDLDIETVTEIFIRVNSEGIALSQADFAMSKIAVNETYGGNTLRKAIDYFCHAARSPDFFQTIEKDSDFAASDFFHPLSWLHNENDDLYDPSYTDMLRVAFTSEFARGRLADLVALLSGRNFETKQYEEAIVQDSFARLKQAILRFMNETHFKRFIIIIRSAGFVDPSLIGSATAIDFAYILYLTLRAKKMPDADIGHHVRRWFVLSVLTGRYSASPESTMDYDIRQIHIQGIEAFADGLIRGELSDAFWNASLPQALNTAASNSREFRVFKAAQVKLNDRGFLSQDITARELVEVKCDVHHIFPRDYLKKAGLTRSQYNQVANYALAQTEINIAIGNKEPKVYFSQMLEQCNGGPKRYGNITALDELRENYRMNCIPDGVETMVVDTYQDFLAQRRELMAKKIRTYFESL